MTPIAHSSEASQSEPGSFRDRNGRIYYVGDKVYRGISRQSHAHWKMLSQTGFYRTKTAEGKLIATEELLDAAIPEPAWLSEWACILRHEAIPFVSYPYEWSFGMLKDAALLQLELLDASLREGMTMKDASSFNIQWNGASPVFIDIPSFERQIQNTPWIAYRQFCKLFLYPLFLQAYKGIPFHAWLRGSIEGIDPEECSRLMSLRDRLRPGVMMDVYLQAKLQEKYADSDRAVREDLKQSGFSTQLILANVKRLRNLIFNLKWSQLSSEWSEYAANNSYNDIDSAEKEQFVRASVSAKPRDLVWDIGCNTGKYSRIAAESARYVVAMDYDHLAVERLFRELKAEGNKSILPLVMNIADSSPNLGWRGLERKALVERGTPALTLCLALLHHVVITANVPMREFLEWIASLGTDLVIEFVTKDDSMVKKLLKNREDQYSEYTLENFEQVLGQLFSGVQKKTLASGTRALYSAVSRNGHAGS